MNFHREHYRYHLEVLTELCIHYILRINPVQYTT